MIGVKAKYLQTESEESTVEIEIPTADNFARVSLSVVSDNNAAVSSQIVNLLNVDTARPTSVTTDSEGKAVIASLAKGTYMVNVSSDLYDDYNTRVEVNGDTEVEIVLAETVIDPYNLIYQASSANDGSSIVELWWNGDLGFRDSFEDYDDFVQEFGDWTVIDGDRMPTYAFSISGVMVVKPQSRGEVGAMIFNPFATEPIQASMDGLFITPFGNKYVMFNSAEQARSNDWLISPTVKIGSDYVLRFVAKSYDSMYPGSFEICVLKDKNTAAPDVLDAFYLTSDWMQYELSLKAYEGENIELAFHHTTYDGWLSFIDDFYVGPSEDNPDRTGTAGNCTFDVWVDGQYHSNVATPYLKLVNLTAGEHKVGVQAVYASGKKSNVTEITFNVGSGAIDIVADSSASEWKIFNLNGQQVVADKLSPGVYIRTNGSHTEKLIIK